MEKVPLGAIFLLRREAQDFDNTRSSTDNVYRYSREDLIRILQVSPRQGAGDFLRLLWDMLFVASKPLLVGTGVIGLMAGFVTYFVTLEAIRDVRRLRHRRHPRPAPGDLSKGDGRRRP